MYDYAIDKFVPVRFFDYVNQKWLDKGPAATLEIPEGVPAPAAGLTYLQIAREGLGFQKTQNGGGTLPVPVAFNSAYHRYGSRVPAAEQETSFFDGIDVSINGIATLATGDTKFLKDGLSGISRLASDAMKQYAVDRPSAIAPLLAEGLKATRALVENVRSSALAEPGKSDVLFELRVKEQQFEKTLAASLEISFQTTVAAEEPGRGGRGRGAAPSSTDAAFLAARAGRGGGTTFTIAIPRQSFAIEAQIFNEGPVSVGVGGVGVVPSDGKNWNLDLSGIMVGEVKGGTQAQWRFDVTVPPDAALTRPYFARPDEEQPYYDLIDARYRNLPSAPYPLAVRARLSFHGVPFEIAQDVQTSERVPGIGTIQNPLLVGPAISVSVSPTAGAVPLESKSFAFTCTVHSNVKGPAQGKVHLKLPPGWRSNPAESPFSFSRDGEDQTLMFSVTPDTVKQAAYTITAVAEYNGKSYAEGYHLTGYPGVRPYPFYRPATYT